MDKEYFLTKLRLPGTVGIFSFLLALLVTVGLSHAASHLNFVFMVVLLVLFLFCVRMIPGTELPEFYRYTAWVLFFAFFLNTWYELLHAGLYKNWTSYSYPVIVHRILIAAAADAMISWALFNLVAVIRKGRWDWGKPWNLMIILATAFLGLAGQTIAELFALKTGRWSYGPLMPTIPVLGVGLTPVVQIPLTTFATFWLAQRASCRVQTALIQK
jgi:hypothetical protein